MDNTMINILISDFAKEIKKRIEGGKIYGIPVDMNNVDHVIVAAYLVSEMEQINLFEKQREIENTLFSEKR